MMTIQRFKSFLRLSTLSFRMRRWHHDCFKGDNIKESASMPKYIIQKNMPKYLMQKRIPTYLMQKRMPKYLMHESMPKYPCKKSQNILCKKIMQNLWQAPVQIKLNPGDALMTMQKQFQRGEYKFYNKELLLQLKTHDEECESLKLCRYQITNI